MLKKLLTTRYFANAFNSFVDRRIVDKLGKSGVFLSIVLIPIFALLPMFAYSYFLLLQNPPRKENENLILAMAMCFNYLLSFALPVYVLRNFIKKYSAKAFAFFMIFPLIQIVYMLYVMDFQILPVETNAFAILWWVLEVLALVVVIFYKPYSHYRAFQIVGSLALISGAGLISPNSAILAWATVIFWILSTAHILFRDKLLDYLEKR